MDTKDYNLLAVAIGRVRQEDGIIHQGEGQAAIDRVAKEVAAALMLEDTRGRQFRPGKFLAMCGVEEVRRAKT